MPFLGFKGLPPRQTAGIVRYLADCSISIYLNSTVFVYDPVYMIGASFAVGLGRILGRNDRHVEFFTMRSLRQRSIANGAKNCKLVSDD